MNDSILKGVILMAMGMTVVFSFLILLIAAMKALAHFLPRLSWMMPDPEPAKPREGTSGGIKSEVALAIAAAWRRLCGGNGG